MCTNLLTQNIGYEHSIVDENFLGVQVFVERRPHHTIVVNFDSISSPIKKSKVIYFKVQ